METVSLRTVCSSVSFLDLFLGIFWELYLLTSLTWYWRSFVSLDFLFVRPLDEKINPSQNEAQSILRNDHISQACPVQNSLVESTGKLPRQVSQSVMQILFCDLLHQWSDIAQSIVYVDSYAFWPVLLDICYLLFNWTCCFRPMGEETNCSRNEDQCVVQSDHVSLVRPQNNSVCWIPYDLTYIHFPMII